MNHPTPHTGQRTMPRLRTPRIRSGFLIMAVWLCLTVWLLAACSGGAHSGSRAPATEGGDVADASARKSWAGKDPAPAIPTDLTWFNVQRPLTLQALKGRVVLLDFWTLGCINCQHIIPDLKKLEEEFGNQIG